jgi:hypothetical protein
VKINGALAMESKEERTHHIRVSNNDISCGGRIFLSGIGVFSIHASNIDISQTIFTTCIIQVFYVAGYGDILKVHPSIM